MRKNSMGMMKLGAIGALTGLVLVPIINTKTRKKISRGGRNAYFRMTDIAHDLKDLISR